MFQKTLSKIRLFFHKEKEPFLSLYNILGFLPEDIALYKEALRHKSYHDVTKGNAKVNNERMEFLGDAVLGAIVADIVYDKYPKEQEGYLTNLRSKLVKRETLNKLAVQIGLDKMIQHSDKMALAHNSYMNGNAFEAFIGAIYLDKGYETCKNFVSHKILEQIVDVNEVAHKEENFKSRLIEWCQKYQLECNFKIISEKKMLQQNACQFLSEVVIEGVNCGKGTGFSKKESHQKAAKAAMKRLKNDVGFVNSLFDTRNNRIKNSKH